MPDIMIYIYLMQLLESDVSCLIDSTRVLPFNVSLIMSSISFDGLLHVGLTV